MTDRELYEKMKDDDKQHRTSAYYYLPFFLLSLPLTVGCMIAISSYDKYIKSSFPSAFLGGTKLNSGLWALASSLFPLGGCIGTFFSVTVSNKIGDKRTAFGSVLVGLIGSCFYISSYFLSSYIIYCISRLAFGFSSGGMMAVGIVYLYDLVVPKKHFILSVSVQLLINIGILISGISSIEYVIKTRWYVTAVPLFVLQIISIIVIVLLPKSPIRVFRQTRNIEKTKKILRKIRIGREKDIEKEAFKINESISQNENAEKIGILYLIRERKFRNPLFITSICAIFQQFSGINVAILYATDIVSKVGFSQLDLGNVILFADCALGSLIFAFIIPHFGSKTMLVVGHFMMAVSYLLAFTFNLTGIIPSWVTVLMLSQFLFWFQAGPGPKPWTIFSETFEPQYREAAQGLLSLSNWISNFLITLIYPFIGDYIGFYSVLMFAVLNLLFSIFFMGFMVETKNKTPKQITEEYSEKRLKCF